MNRYVLTATGLLLGSLVLAGCTTAVVNQQTPTVVAETTISTVTATLTAAEVMAENEDYTTVNDDEWSPEGATSIDLSAESGTVTITEAGVYQLSGELEGQVVVAAPDDALVAILLDDATITSTAGAAIEVQSADDVVVSLGGDSSLSATGFATDAQANAALFSEADLTITGSGSLTVGSDLDGITSEDDLVVLSGTITVESGDDGLRGKDALAIEGGALVIDAGGDGLKSDNAEEAARGYILQTGGTVTVTAGDDGASAASDLLPVGGQLSVSSTGKGLSGEMLVVLEGTEIAIEAGDDAIHSNGSVHVNAGTVSVTSGDDGVHAEASLVIDGGTLTATAVEGLEAFAVVLNDGVVRVTASDDGISASGGDGGVQPMQDSGQSITITGGDIVIDAAGDGFDSNGSATMSGGTLVVYGPTTEREGALDVNGTFTVSGGTLFAIGSAGMPVSPGTDSAQSWISALPTGTAGDTVQVLDGAGAVLAEFTATKAFGSVVYSSSALADGATYSVSVSGAVTSVTEGVATVGTMPAPGTGGGPRP